MILHLTLKKEWYDMIEAGTKTEEYREVKTYWIKRLFRSLAEYDFMQSQNCFLKNPKHHSIVFRNGYNKTARQMEFKLISIEIGMPKFYWTDEPDKDVFILKLGERL